MKKILIICMLTLITLSGCEQKEEINNNEIKEPQDINNNISITPHENVTIDIYKDYDVKEFVDVEEGVTLVEELDEENSILKITAIKGDDIKTIEFPVTIINTSPYPITCKMIPKPEKYIYDGTTYVFINETDVIQYSDGYEDRPSRGKLEKNNVVFPSWGYPANQPYRLTKESDYIFSDSLIIRRYYECDKPLPFE